MTDQEKTLTTFFYILYLCLVEKNQSLLTKNILFAMERELRQHPMDIILKNLSNYCDKREKSIDYKARWDMRNFIINSYLDEKDKADSFGLVELQIAYEEKKSLEKQAN